MSKTLKTREAEKDNLPSKERQVELRTMYNNALKERNTSLRYIFKAFMVWVPVVVGCIVVPVLLVYNCCFDLEQSWSIHTVFNSCLNPSSRHSVIDEIIGSYLLGGAYLGGIFILFLLKPVLGKNWNSEAEKKTGED